MPLTGELIMWIWLLLTGLVLVLIVFNMLYLRFQLTYDLLFAEREKYLCIGVIPVFKRFKWEKKISAPASAGEWLDLATGLIGSRSSKEKNREDAVPKNNKGRKRTNSDRHILKIPFRDYYHLFRILLSHVILEKLDWRTSLGLDDAMNTALACGGIWAFKGNFMGLVSHFSSLEQVELAVEPVYNQTGISSQLDSIFKIRIVYIMLIIIVATFISVRGYINGRAAGKAQPSY